MFHKYWRFDQKIKREARGRLRGKWSIALAVLVFPFLTYLLNTFLGEAWLTLTGVAGTESQALLQTSSAVISLALNRLFTLAFLFFIFRPLFLGFILWCTKVARGLPAEFRTVFAFFAPGKYMPAIQYSFRRLIRLLLWALATVGVSLVLGTGLIVLFHLSDPGEAFENFGQQGMKISSAVTYLVCLVVGILSWMLVTLRYFLADYLFVTEETYSPYRDPMHRSRVLMCGYKTYIWPMLVSFLGWVLLCIFVFPALYVLPFLFTSVAVSQKWILYDRAQREKRQTEVSACPEEGSLED